MPESHENPNTCSFPPASFEPLVHTHDGFIAQTIPLGVEQIQVSVELLQQWIDRMNAQAGELRVLRDTLRDFAGARESTRLLEAEHRRQLVELRTERDKALDQASTVSKQREAILSVAVQMYDALTMARPDVASQVTGLTQKAFTRSTKFTTAKVTEAIAAWCDL